ncbi:growth hormone secretagogue receptor type 1-like isoform X1 [Bradysia coprophila]|uniref:growth hormone secretagogue receptor type 1-like isoform X1 n=1 Tax=Bradysia coprophila TaxID=38358 RepID=UPI00187D70B0|nr:growth hormone secretagogue receptor type 1-like isoform X1 [Bradysia coprophila]XP_037030496.1 growth hormone secretagogue receptor type 1-like isoform X1 [Bradysia coprophila]
MVFCVTIMLLGVIGNVMVPIVIMRTKDMRNSTNIFLTNLSIADLLVLLVCTPTVLVEVNSKPETWVMGSMMCKAVPFVELTVAHASVLTILAISFERYYAICEPLKAGYVCTKARALLICLAAWAVAAVFTSPILTIAQYGYEEYFDGSTVAVCLTSVESSWSIMFFVGSISLFFILPFIILLVLYTVIAKHLMDNPGITSHGNRSNVLKYRKQVIFMLGAVVLSFFVCLLPFRALTLWIIIVPSETILSLGIEGYYSLLYFCRIMLYLNSAMNPILYNLMSSKFRDGFLRLLHCKSLVKNRLVSGTRKGTFHTTSTNLSSSQSGDKRKSSRIRDDPEYIDRSIKSRRSVDNSVDESSKIRTIEANSIVNGNAISCTNDVIPETDEEPTIDIPNDRSTFLQRNIRSTMNPKLQRLCNKSTSFESDAAYKPNRLDHCQTKYNNGHPKIDVETSTTPSAQNELKNDSTAMLARTNENAIEAIESPPNNFESEQLNIGNNCHKKHQHHDSAHNNGADEYNEYQSFLCRKRDLESLV